MRKKWFLYLASGLLAVNSTVSCDKKDVDKKSSKKIINISEQRSIVDKVLDYESKAELIEEAVIPILTLEDESTLEALKTFSENYYEAIDRLIEAKGTITSKDYSPIFYELVGKPLGNHILANNKELRSRIIKLNNGRFSTIKEFYSFLEDYFIDKGVYLAAESKLGSFGSIASIVAYKIKSKGRISGNIFGHNVEGISSIGFGEEINPSYEVSRLRKRMHVGKLHTHNHQYQHKRKRLVHGYSDIDNTFREFEKRAAKADFKRKSKNASELIDKLLFNRLYGDNQGITEEKKRAYLKSVWLHEDTHALFHILYSHKNIDGITYSNRSEQSSYLTELVTARDNIIYLRFANYLAMGNDVEYKEGAGEFLNFCVNYVYNNRTDFRNINFDAGGKDLAQDILMQFDKLSVPQIRNLAARYLVTNFPRHLEKLK